MYELARRLDKDGFNICILFISNNIYSSPRASFTKRFLSRHVPPYSTRRQQREKFLVSRVAEVENFQSVDLIVSPDITSVKARRIFATHFSTAHYVNRCHSEAQKFYLIEHSEDDPSYSGRLSDVARESYSFPLRKIVTNKKMYDRFENEKPLFLQLGFATDFYKLITPIEGRGQTVLFPLLQNESKGGIYGIEAMRLLKAELPNLATFSFGDWPSSQVPSFVTEYFSNFSRGSYTGPRNSTLLRLYNSASVFVLPSLVEGFSLPTLEAMHSGCAVVVTNNGGVNEYIRHQFNGLVVETKDSLALRNATLSLLSDERKRTEMARNGVDTADKYSFERSYESFLSILGLESSLRAAGSDS